MKKVIFSIFAVSVIGVSCQKDNTPDIVPPTPVTYMSLAAGSSWNYELVENTAPASTYTYTLASTNRDSSINGKLYHVFTNSSGSANEYYTITGNDYYNFRKLPSALGGSSVEYIYLKDNVAVGGSWIQTFPVTFSGITVVATLTNTITNKGITKIVKGVTYNDVIHVTTTITFTGIPLTSAQFSSDIQSFYAAKYGMIETVNKVNLDFSGIKDQTDQRTSLATSDIK